MPAPIATYRIQFNSAFDFTRARRIVSYLRRLGISDIYASPIFKAKKDSMHGYDVIDPGCVNPELGSAAAFDALLQEVSAHSMCWIQDIVPNHMAFDGENVWLMDIFEKGKKSPYWRFFDIEWQGIHAGLKGKVSAPLLGRLYSQCLAEGELRIRYDKGSFSINYYDLKLPLMIKTYPDIFLKDIEKLKTELGKKSNRYRQYLVFARRFRTAESKTGKLYEGYVTNAKNQIFKLYAHSATIRKFVDRNIKDLNGRKGHPESFQSLDRLLSRQMFHLSFWKSAAHKINYRRFFTVNELISLRVEDKKVFKKTHHFIFELLKSKKICGLRIDHIDGLYDPKEYLQRLKKAFPEKYLIVEKILENDEQLPPSWPAEGTTGYEFLNYINGIFVCTKNADDFEKLYHKLSGASMPFDKIVSSKKRLIIDKHMAGDIDNLASLLRRMPLKSWYGRDMIFSQLQKALAQVLIAFPRYRTYTDGDGIQSGDRSCIRKAINRARKNNPELAGELNFFADILLLNFKNNLTESQKKHWMHFVRRFQQFSGPLMAKGFEDTALYVYNRLISLNEVGGNPDRFGVPLEEFHAFIQSRRVKWPHSMNTTATHDTKRGEDVRARINVLSEMPDRWAKKVRLWQKQNQAKKAKISGKSAQVPDKNDEYFLYQTLIGGMPFRTEENKNFEQRLKSYVIKAARESKVHTSWREPDRQYEESYLKFITEIIKPSGNNIFLKDFLAFEKEIAHYGIFNSLSQIFVKLTVPGVPDFYQGCELWDFSFVDPDNRRPVDFDQRKNFLLNIEKYSKKDQIKLIHRLVKTKETGEIKLFLTARLLNVRNLYNEIFSRGHYVPLTVSGKYKENIIAFFRRYKNYHILTIAPRFLTKVVKKNQNPLGDIWGNTNVLLPKSDRLRCCLTGSIFKRKKLYVKDVFNHFPGAVLTNAD